MNSKINENIKFRKFGRFGKCLSVKADMLEEEIKRFDELLNKDIFNKDNYKIKLQILSIFVLTY